VAALPGIGDVNVETAGERDPSVIDGTELEWEDTDEH
jgi:hypothetical protein